MNYSKIYLKAVIFLFAFLMSGVSGVAQTPPGSAIPLPTPSATPGAITALASLNHSILLNFLHHVNNAEISEANNALLGSESQQVRTYAQTMLTDHQQNEQLITQLANQKGLPLYQYQPSTVEIATDSQLDNLSRSDFDSAYLQIQLTEHQKTLQDLRLLQAQVNDPDLQNFINQTISVIQGHIDLANSSLNSVSSGGTTSSTPMPSGTPPSE